MKHMMLRNKPENNMERDAESKEGTGKYAQLGGRNKCARTAARVLVLLLCIAIGMGIPGMEAFGIADISTAEAAASVNYSAVFNARYYADHNPDVYAAFGYNYRNLLNHFITYGMSEGRRASESFDVQAYRNRYADLQNSFGDNLKAYYLHYIYCGKAEGRNAYPEGYVPSGQAASSREVTEEEVRAYYDRTVFVGDSLMEGYRNYALLSSASVGYQSDFLAVRSFSLYHALRSSTVDQLQPVFQGERKNIWDAIPQMDVDRVFLLFGTNDLVSSNPDTIFNEYVTLLDKIRETSPDVEIHVIGMPPAYPGASKGVLGRDGIQALNALLKNNADLYGYEYVDLYSYLADENGDLPKDLCSDKLIHETRSAYETNWEAALYDHAVECIRSADSTVSANGVSTDGAGI